MAEYTISKIKLPNNDVCNLKDNTAVNKAGDTMTGDLNISKANPFAILKNPSFGNINFGLQISQSGHQGIYSTGYWDGSQFVSSWSWFAYRGNDGRILHIGDWNGEAIPVGKGGTGATTAADAVQNLFSTGTDAITEYPTKPGIYRTTQNSSAGVFAHMQPASLYGTLVIFRAEYGMHLYICSSDSANHHLYFGFSGNTFGEPATWYDVSATVMPVPQA